MSVRVGFVCGAGSKQCFEGRMKEERRLQKGKREYILPEAAQVSKRHGVDCLCSWQRRYLLQCSKSPFYRVLKWKKNHGCESGFFNTVKMGGDIDICYIFLRPITRNWKINFQEHR